MKNILESSDTGDTPISKIIQNKISTINNKVQVQGDNVPYPVNFNRKQNKGEPWGFGGWTHSPPHKERLMLLNIYVVFPMAQG